jgi:signal transduction histidine kinase
MMRLRTLLPSTVTGQITLLVVMAVGLMHLSATVLFALDEKDGPMQGPSISRFETFVQVLEHVPREIRPSVIAAIASVDPDLHIAAGKSSDLLDTAHDRPPLSLLRQTLGPNYSVGLASTHDALPGEDEPTDVVVRLPDGDMVTARLTPPDHPFSGPSGAVIGTLLFIALNVGLLSFWAARSLTTPLTRFVRAAESFSVDRDPAPLPDRGPQEIRMAARALNRLRDRIRRMVEDRTRMLAAVSHDLRTPITRLRLRTEFIEDESIREATLRDLDQMSSMVHACLSYLRDGQASKNRSVVDLPSLLQTIVNQFVDMGKTVTYEGPDRLAARLDPNEVERAVTNLIENAVKFGTNTVVHLMMTGNDQIQIDVVDDGPGIPEGERDAMLEPFARGDAARSLNDAGGFGLGLSIARAVAEGHGGKLSLHNAQPTGLIARICIPTNVSDSAARG